MGATAASYSRVAAGKCIYSKQCTMALWQRLTRRQITLPPPHPLFATAGVREAGGCVLFILYTVVVVYGKMNVFRDALLSFFYIYV
jgi:hypothetical protein